MIFPTYFSLSIFNYQIHKLFDENESVPFTGSLRMTAYERQDGQMKINYVNRESSPNLVEF